MRSKCEWGREEEYEPWLRKSRGLMDVRNHSRFRRTESVEIVFLLLHNKTLTINIGHREGVIKRGKRKSKEE